MARSKHSKNRKRVTQLWLNDPHCYWCKIKTVRANGVQHQKLTPDTATFDHLYHKTNPLRRTRKGRNLGVLACYECNQRRGRDEHIQSLPRWNRWLIKAKIPIPVWKVRKKVASFKKKFRIVYKNANWLKRHLKYRLRQLKGIEQDSRG